MKNIVFDLQNYFLPYIDHSFAWKIPKNCPVTLTPNTTPKQQHIELKTILSKKLHEDSTLKTHYWIIREWGGIKGFNQNPTNDELLRRLPDYLASGVLPKEIAERLSSFSKVASFLFPKQYAIYDSRVIFSLNWLLLKHQREKALLFEQPQTRNATLSKYHLETIIRLSGLNVGYGKQEQAFHRYCQMMRDFSQILFNDADKPYQAEMLLFQIAPNLIIQDIHKTIQLNFVNN